MSISDIENFFYSIASSRISKRVEASGLRYAEIYRPDHKQISRIVNNKRNKNNRFLICDAVIRNFYKDDETGESVECGLLATKELEFASVKEILWGTKSEISNYLHDLFLILWDEISVNTSTYNIDVELYKCDYVPYAKYSTYSNILLKSKYPAIFFGVLEDTVFEELGPSEEDAITYLYQKCKKQFASAFSSFAETHLTFHKLDNIIKNELLPLFVKILKNNRPNLNSLGLRVRYLILADLSQCASIVAQGRDDNNHKSLINASCQYIIELESIQKKLFNIK